MHEKAIYIHGGQQYHVEHLDFKERKAYVKQVDVDYYTDAIRYTQVRVLEIADTKEKQRGNSARTSRSHGDVLVRSQVVGFKKIKFFTNENVGAGQLELPENEMHTTSYWITLDRALIESLPYYNKRTAIRDVRIPACAGIGRDAFADVRWTRFRYGDRRKTAFTGCSKRRDNADANRKNSSERMRTNSLSRICICSTLIRGNRIFGASLSRT